jgi:hypothetical protein
MDLSFRERANRNQPESFDMDGSDSDSERASFASIPRFRRDRQNRICGGKLCLLK